MNGNTDFDRIAQSWLQDGPTEMPDRSLQAALDEVHVTSQQRFGPARRAIPMNGNTWRVAAAAVIGLLIILGGITFLGGRQGGVGGAPATATPSADVRHRLPSAAARVPPQAGTAWGRTATSRQPLPPCRSPLPAGWAPGRRRLRRRTRRPDRRSVTADQQPVQRSPARTTRSSRPTPGPGVDELLAALASQPGIDAGPITDVTVDGYRGKSVELTVATDIATCPADSGKTRCPASGSGPRLAAIAATCRAADETRPDLRRRRRRHSGSRSLPGSPARLTAADRADSRRSSTRSASSRRPPAHRHPAHRPAASPLAEPPALTWPRSRPRLRGLFVSGRAADDPIARGR